VSFKPYIRSARPGADLVSIKCPRVPLASVKGLVWSSHWSQVEIQVEGLENVAWKPEVRMLEFAAKALKGISRMEAEDQISLWKRASEVLGKLMDLGWQIHAGAMADLLVIVFTKRNSDELEADVAWDEDPDSQGAKAIGDWIDGLSVLHRRR
jgi:hypothetical protein